MLRSARHLREAVLGCMETSIRCSAIRQWSALRSCHSSMFSTTTKSMETDLAQTSTQMAKLQSWSGADMQIEVHDSFENMKPMGQITLPGTIFNAPIRTDLVHRVVIWQLAKRRQGTSKTKGRSEVSASGRKIRPQKGSGRARHGARSSPIFRGGGRAHGPVPRNYDFAMPFKVRRNALRSTLSSKLINGQLKIVESAAIIDGKTRSVVSAMERHSWRSALVVDHDPEGTSGVHDSLHKASHNVKSTLAINALGLNVYDALAFDMLIMTRAALTHLTNRYAKYDWLF